MVAVGEAEYCNNQYDSCYNTFISRFKDIIKINGKKGIPDELRTRIETMKQIEHQIVTNRNEINGLNNSEGVFKDIQTRKNKIRKHNHRIFGLQKEIVQMFPIKPLIIVTRKIINT